MPETVSGHGEAEHRLTDAVLPSIETCALARPELESASIARLSFEPASAGLLTPPTDPLGVLSRTSNVVDEVLIVTVAWALEGTSTAAATMTAAAAVVLLRRLDVRPICVIALLDLRGGG
jgi:hypothetical protein